MKGKNDTIRTIFNIVTVLIFIEFVLGGLGHLFGLPIRKGLFVVGIVFSVYMILREKISFHASDIIIQAFTLGI